MYFVECSLIWVCLVIYHDYSKIMGLGKEEQRGSSYIIIKGI